ncbi:MAG: pyridoxal-phosphate-dependent aminotransferase family protein [Nitrososphaerales archaeon]
MKKLLMLPGPTNVPDRVMNAMLGSIINHRGPEFHELYKRIRSNCQKVFETENEIVVLSSSGTGGVDAAVSSILNSQDSVVVPSFGEFSSRLGDSARYTGARVVSPVAELGHVPNLSEVEKAMNEAKNPKALCVVYNETSTGVTWRQLKELKEIATKHGALFVVDAISVLGGDNLPVDELGIDICIAGSQKCLACPPGVVILSFSEDAKKAMSMIKPRNQYFDISKYFQFAQHDETPATPSLPLFFALDEALKLVLEEGLHNRLKRHKLCASAFYSGFESIGMKAFADPEFRSNVVIGINYPSGIDDAKFRSLLSERFGIIVGGGFGKLKGSMFRIGSMGIIDSTMVTATVAACAETLSMFGFKCDSSKAVASAQEKLQSLI